MTTAPQVRAATWADAKACAGIYAGYVLDTAITFESDPPTTDEMAGRIAAAERAHAWLVAEAGDGDVLGYAYAGPYKTRAAYRWSCETSVYVDPAAQGRGIGRTLYAALLTRLGERGYLLAIASMTVPNAASTALHRSMGFTSSGVLRQVGWKRDSWHDVELLQRPLGTRPAADRDPPEPA